MVIDSTSRLLKSPPSAGKPEQKQKLTIIYVNFFTTLHGNVSFRRRREFRQGRGRFANPNHLREDERRRHKSPHGTLRILVLWPLPIRPFTLAFPILSFAEFLIFFRPISTFLVRFNNCLGAPLIVAKAEREMCVGKIFSFEFCCEFSSSARRCLLGWLWKRIWIAFA